MARAGLTTARVVSAAAELVDRDGLESLSLSTLADSLGVRVPSLYKHVHGLDDLRNHLAAEGAAGLREALQRAVDGRQASAALRAASRAYRQFARSYPGQYDAVQRAPRPSDPQAGDAAEIVALLTGVVAGYGISGTDVVHAVRVVRSALHGFAELERVSGFGLRASIDATFRALVATLDAGLRAWHQPAHG